MPHLTNNVTETAPCSPPCFRKAPTRAIQALLLAVLVSACASPAYYTQAVSGHYSLMNKREDIASLLRDNVTDTELAAKLELAESIREFGIRELELEDTGAYHQYVATGRDAVTWNVVAAPEFSLHAKRWCFLVSGCVPYRGYFIQADAGRFAKKLAAKGYDVAISPATAYSTLGWFDDPVLDTMFRQGDTGLAAVLFHEMAHHTLYVKGDAAFSEAFATFVEGVGVERWLHTRGEPDLFEQWRRKEAAALQFNDFLRKQRARLEALYSEYLEASVLRSKKQEFFNRLRQSYRQWVTEHWDGNDYYGAWVNGELNNAHLALLSTYQGGACAFAGLFLQAGKNMRRFMDLAKQRAALDKINRSAWLQQDCSAVAPEGDL